MKIKIVAQLFCVFLPAVAFCLRATAQGTAFNYQGQLNDGAGPATGNFDLTFKLFDASSAGGQVGNTLTNPAVAISNGLFNVALDFGNQFSGADRWLEIAVRTNGSGSFTNVTPRQKLLPVPYAIMANSSSNLLGQLPAAQLSAGTAAINISGSAASFTGSLSGDVTGSQSATVVSTVSGVTAANVASGANLANAATSANSANAIVKRDGSSTFAAGTITLSGNLNLPATTATTGIIRSGANTLLHTFGPANTFVGVSAGNLAVTGSGNVGVGFNSMNHNTSGLGNTAVGQTSLANNTTGGDNTAIGFSALLSNTNGTYNTGLGMQALVFNTSGNDNTAVGAFSLNNNTVGSQNTAVGALALESNTTGGDNTAVGFFALNANTTSFDNTAVGTYALLNNTNGSENTAIGDQALESNTSGSDNTVVGASAMFYNTVGSHNTAVGFQALTSNTNGSQNTAMGESALNQNLTGYDNTAVGYTAMYQNVDGAENVAAGFQALYNNTNGTYNTAIGNNALISNKSGNQNTAVGYSALDLTTSHNNIALGYAAGLFVSAGGTNIHIGNQGLTTDTNLIRIGTSQTRTFIAGISGVTISPAGAAVFINTNGQLGTINSSARFKEDIRSMNDASDVLLALRPVTFRYKPDLDPAGTPQFGLVAEEVEKVNPALVLRDEQSRIYTVRYEAINAMLLNEFLKEHHRVEAQTAKLQELSRKVDAQDLENAELKQKLEMLERAVSRLNPMD